MGPQRTVIMKNLRPVALAILFGAHLLAGCAFVDQRLDLTYEPVVRSPQGTGSVLLARPVVAGVPRRGGDWLIGTARNAAGARTAEVLTGSDVGDWLNSALLRELTNAGYQVEPAAALPAGVRQGILVTITTLSVDDEIQVADRVAGARADLAFALELWRDGAKVKTLNIHAQGGAQYGGFFSPAQKSLALKKALQSAMQQAVPEIVGSFER